MMFKVVGSTICTNETSAVLIRNKVLQTCPATHLKFGQHLCWTEVDGSRIL